ncbi:MAG: pentapeptide repeat-containing protein, partial [Nostoc sp.]|uniref:pentapeptide repeat-containing protein n=1 Tax=Nostoc sp. TaxID=1180 RepID=UPI002FF97DB3
NLSGADLTKANLTGSNLTNANLSGADLTKANLSDTDLTNAKLINNNLSDVDLTGANLTNTIINSASKAFEEFLEADQKIVLATSELDGYETTLENICKKIQEEFKFDFISISLVMPEQNTIEAVYGTGIAKKWVDQVRHHIDEEKNLRDIQADIVKTCQTEIIVGWDKRFDLGVYDRFKHDSVSRIFTPIFLVDDENNKLMDDWFKKYNWENNFIQKQEDGHRVFHMDKLPDNISLEVIGTLEAGYEKKDKSITDQQVILLAKLLAEEALSIRRIRLNYVLETIAESARKLFHADLTTLHFLWNPQQEGGKYTYEIFSGNPGPTPVNKFYPRQRGLGWQAITEQKVKVIYSSQEDGTLNPEFSEKARERGSRAYTAIPLLINSEDKVILRSISTINEKDNAQKNEQLKPLLVGVLYVHYWEESQFSKELVEQLRKYFINKAVVAIRNVIKYQKLREKTRQLSALQSITQSFNEIGSKLVSYIAWNTLNALAADVVVIYEYIQAENKFPFAPTFAGKFLENKNMDTETIDDNAVPWSLIKGEKDIYASKISDEPILENSSFVNREKIKSAAGILLKANNDLLGVMFINYRRIHNFVDEEKEIINSLASSAATAIHNQRWSETRDSIELGIITNQEDIKLIVQKAVQITGADVGEITIFDKNNKKIITQENYASDNQFEVSYRHEKITENDAAWVKMYEKPRCISDVNDVETKLKYQAYFNNINSELGVSVWDQNKSQRGLLIVASHQKEKFNESDRRKLEDISSLAYIAVHYAETDKTIREQTIATVGDLCRKLLSRINNDKDTTKVVLSILKELISQLHENNVEEENLTSLEHILLSKEPPVKQIINDLNESNVEDSKQRGNISLELISKEVDKTSIMFSQLSSY